MDYSKVISINWDSGGGTNYGGGGNLSEAPGYNQSDDFLGCVGPPLFLIPVFSFFLGFLLGLVLCRISLKRK